MEKKYRFLKENCYFCGLELADKTAELAAMKINVPMGFCPRCHRALPLIEVKPKAKKAEPEVVAEEESAEKAASEVVTEEEAEVTEEEAT